MTKTNTLIFSAVALASALSFVAPAQALPMLSNGVKWCSGEWLCDPKGCICIKKKKGGTTAIFNSILR